MFFSNIVLMEDFLFAFGDKFAQIVNLDPLIRFFVYLEFFLLILRVFLVGVAQQIDQFLIVELQKTYPHQIFFCVCCPFDCIVNVGNRSGNDPLHWFRVFVPFHRVSFSCPGLPISKDCSIVAFKHTLDDREGCVLEDALLFAVRTKSWIKCKVPDWVAMCFLWVGCMHCDHPSPFIDLDDDLKALLLLLIAGRPAPDDDFDCFGLSMNFRHVLNI